MAGPAACGRECASRARPRAPVSASPRRSRAPACRALYRDRRGQISRVPQCQTAMSASDLDFTIARLGEGRFPSPMAGVRFTGEDERVLYHATLAETKPWLERGQEPPSMEAAGAREKLYFDPATLGCGIVTCGGLCPGLNDVIRAIVLSLHHHYGVRRTYGFRYGYEGLVRRHGHDPLELTADSVGRIHELGGSILGSSRG